jgi:hypothetical protein
LQVEWIDVQLWHGEIAGYEQMPSDRRWHRIAWGEGALFGADHTRPSAKGRFERLMSSGQRFDATWRLFWGLTEVPAVVRLLDEAQRRFVVEPSGAVRWVTMRVEAEPPWLLWQFASAHAPRCIGRHDTRPAIPVALGQSVHGALLRPLPGTEQRTLAWWTITAGVDEVTVWPANGRQIELRPAAACENRGVLLVGPNGQWDAGFELSAATPRSLFVPDGTRAIAVFDGNHIEATLRELPVPATDFLVID